MRKSTVKVTVNNTAKALRALESVKTEVIAETTAAVEATAKVKLQEYVYDQPEPSGYSRTGNLMNSTGSDTTPDEGVVFSSADYAVYVHEGNRSRTRRPYLEDALTEEAPKVEARARRLAGGLS